MAMVASSIAGRVGRTLMAAADAVAMPRVSVLMFHRVLPRPDPLFPGETHAAQFDAMMAALSRAARVLTLGDAHRLWAGSGLPARAVVITFDDGYADNAEVALPILRRHGLAASFFVSTGFLDGGRMWNDTVIECVRRSPHAELDLSSFGLGCLPLGDLAQRRSAIEALLPRVKYLSLDARAEALDRLSTLCRRPALPDDLMMRSEQVRQLHESGMEIGGHTVQHPILTEIADEDAKAEIAEGRERLRGLTGAPVDVFAYPNGKPGRDYAAHHVPMVRAAGFRCAVSTSVGIVTAAADPLQWPRCWPWSRSAAGWMARLLRARYVADRSVRV